MDRYSRRLRSGGLAGFGSEPPYEFGALQGELPASDAPGAIAPVHEIAPAAQDFSDRLKPRHLDLLQYWQSLCPAAGEGISALPAKGKVDPVTIPHLLSHIGLIDVETPPRGPEGRRSRFRYRLVGSAMVTVFGFDFSGTWLDESKPGAYGEFLADLYQETVDRGRPVYSESRFEYADERRLWVHRLLLPLIDDTPEHPSAPVVSRLLFSNLFSAPGHEYAPFASEKNTAITETLRLIG